MNTHWVLGVALCTCIGTACQPPVNVESVEAEVRAVLDRYIASVEQEDMEHYAQLVAHDADMMNFGAFGGPIIGWDGLQEVMEGQNAMLDAIQIDQSNVKVHVLATGDNAWATSLWQFKATAGEALLDLPVRCTWQLERRDGNWQIVHFHKSIAAG
jgi:uncharacterized protein (TIGR02246 family)